MTRSSLPTSAAPAPLGLRRRTVLSRSLLGAAATAVALGGVSTGCSSAPVGPDSEDHIDPDLELLDQVTSATRAVLARVEQRAATVGGAGRQRLESTAACLQAHLDHFAPEQTGQVPASPATPSPTAVATPDSASTLRSALEAHTTVLTDAAGQAESGAFARLLAVAAAGLSQHLGRSTSNEEGERP